MSKDTAKLVIDRFAEKFQNIFMIQFFGGEPMMNPDVMEFLCEYICEQSKKYVPNPAANERPRLVLMTNLSLLNERIIGIIKKYGVSVTASIDGPEQINRLTRPMKNGSSHENIVKKTIRMLQEATDGRQPQLIEATYTALHQKVGLSVVDVIRYCKDELKVDRVHVPLSTSQAGTPSAPDHSSRSCCLCRLSCCPHIRTEVFHTDTRR